MAVSNAVLNQCKELTNSLDDDTVVVMYAVLSKVPNKSDYLKFTSAIYGPPEGLLFLLEQISDRVAKQVDKAFPKPSTSESVDEESKHHAGEDMS